MAYATWVDYIELYKGNFLTKNDFDVMILRSSEWLDNHCTVNLKKQANLTSVKLCCCKLAEKIKKKNDEELAGGSIASESIGQWSRTFVKAYQNDLEKPYEAQLYTIAYDYLARYGLLYRGV